MNEARIVLNKAKSSGLIMSRVPDKTREEFIKFAEDNFAGDYGMLLCWCYNQAVEYQKVKDLLMDKNFWKEVKNAKM